MNAENTCRQSPSAPQKLLLDSLTEGQEIGTRLPMASASLQFSVLEPFEERLGS